MLRATALARSCLFVSALSILVWAEARESARAQQNARPGQTAGATQTADDNPASSIEVRVRLEDNSPYRGSASIRLIPADGPPITDYVAGADGAAVFSNILPDEYTVEVSAPGFGTVWRPIRLRFLQEHLIVRVVITPKSPSSSTNSDISQEAIVPDSGAQPAAAAPTPVVVTRPEEKAPAGTKVDSGAQPAAKAPTPVVVTRPEEKAPASTKVDSGAQPAAKAPTPVATRSEEKAPAGTKVTIDVIVPEAPEGPPPAADSDARTATPVPAPASAPMPTPASAGVPLAAIPAPRGSRPAWLPPDIDVSIPQVDAARKCTLPQVLEGTGTRMNEFVANLEKFGADEKVEHFPVNQSGERKSPDVRSFEYVVLVSRNSYGTFLLDEYRNGGQDPSIFPANIATQGLSGMALLFHPAMAVDFDFTCEGLGQFEGRAAWQVHFKQRPDHPSRMRAYVIAKALHPIPLKGRAWIDADTFQVLRLDSELVKPMPDIALTAEYLSIRYAPVEFPAQKLELWLPQAAEIYSERNGRRYFRRHTFSNFKLFMVAAAQNIEAPKAAYKFFNASNQDVRVVLEVTPLPESHAAPVNISFTVPAGATVYKFVGSGKDVNIPVEAVESATFTYDGPPDSIQGETSVGGSIVGAKQKSPR